MSLSRFFVPAAVVLTAAACSLPPYTVSGTPFSVKYAMFVPNIADGIPVVVPAFADQKAPSSTIDVPQEAKSLKFADLTLKLSMTNTGQLPLTTKIYLAPSGTPDVYATTPLGGTAIDIPANGVETDKSFSIDPTLMQNQKLTLGYTFGTPGTTTPITFKADDAININYSIVATVKLF